MSVDSEGGRSVVETIHGTRVVDPYRCLEDRHLPETERWILEHRNIYNAYFQKLAPPDVLRQRILGALDIETTTRLGKVGQRYFYSRRKAGEQQPSIYLRESADGPERVLVRPLRDDSYSSVNIYKISANSELLAYELKRGGEHSKAIHILHVASGISFPDHLHRGLARGFAFRTPGDGYYYCHDVLDETVASEQPHRIMRHRFGTSIDDDQALLILPRDPTSKLVLRSDGDALLAIHLHARSGAPIVDLYLARQDEDAMWRSVCRNVPVPFGPFAHHETIYAHRFGETAHDEIIELDKNDGREVRVIVPEWQVPMTNCVLVGDRLYASYLAGTDTVVHIWSLEGKSCTHDGVYMASAANIHEQHRRIVRQSRVLQ